MTYLLVQIALLMLAAYLCGAICGCLSSRFYHYLVGDRGRGTAVMDRAAVMASQPVIEVSDHTAGADVASSRFERALSHGPSDGGADVGPVRAPAAREPLGERDEVVLDTPTFSPSEPSDTVVSSKTEPAVEATPSEVEDNGEEGEGFTSVSVAAAAGAVAAAAGVAGLARTTSEEEPAAETIDSSVPDLASVSARVAAASIGAAGAVAVATGADDDLTRIKGIDASTSSQLVGAGVTRFKQIAGWSADDVERADAMTGSPGRVSRENWIEQAQMLAGGNDTAYTREKDNDDPDISEPESSELEPSAASEGLSETVSSTSSSSESAGMAVAGLATATAAAAAAASLSVPVSPVSLEASPSEADSEQTPRPVQLSDAIAWKAKRDGTDLTGLRSVRSQALRREPVSGDVDDLKRIRGVGVLIEKKLNSLGISSYQQVANWTGHDIDRISQQMEFSGRIERENWVEQARILASGGHTEFSRRIDRRDG